MDKKDLLFEDWKECVENIRFFRDQINKMSIWEFALFPAVGIAIALKFVVDGSLVYSGITLLLLSFLLGLIDNLAHFNARYSDMDILIAKEIEKKLGTSLVTRIGEEYDRRNEEDKKSCVKKLNLFCFT